MDLVPIQELTVARYSTKVTRIEDIDEQAIKGCLTKSSKIGDGKKTPWDLRVFPIHVEEVNYAFPSILVASENFRTVSCINGIALLKTDDKIETVGGLARPRVLYRAIHSGQPDDDQEYLKHEVLIEHSIPEDSIIAKCSWEKDKSWLDRGGFIEAHARRVQLTRDKVKTLRTKNAQEAKEKAAEKRKADDGDDSGLQEETVREKKKRFKIGPKMTSDLSTWEYLG
ncbi:hypothetical protein EsH8_X_000169 [Colletotrichum jinshuiense]